MITSLKNNDSFKQRDILNKNVEDLFNKALGIVCMHCKLKTFVKIYPAEFPLRLYIVITKMLKRYFIKMFSIQTLN